MSINTANNIENAEKVAILDCGGQYTKVIDRKIRELGVNTDILPVKTDLKTLNGYKALILSGGPDSIAGGGYDSALFDKGLPILGICCGFQIINRHFGGTGRPKTKYGLRQAEISIDTSCELFDGLDKNQIVLMNAAHSIDFIDSMDSMNHGDYSAAEIAEGFECVAKNGETVAAIYNKNKKIAAVQFHPEVELTEHGVKIFENFLRKICGLKEFYKLEDRIETSVNMIKSRVGETGKVIVLVSGGVDSMVTAALLLKALPAENIYAIHVDHGFMRKDESDLTCENLKKLGFKNLLRVNAQDKFLHTKIEIDGGKIPNSQTSQTSQTGLGPLIDITDPETKREIIGSLFIEVVKEASETFNLNYDSTFIAQGTLRPDLIESGNPDVSSYASKIKTHHNDVDIIRKARAKGLIIETNWDWHKDEVRQVARMLGIDEEIASRQPFPGPGLAVRQICSDKEIIIPDDKKFAAFMADKNTAGVIAPILSVGVENDARSYKNLAVLYGGGFDIDFGELSGTVVEIPNNFDFINRCVYVLNKKSLNGLKRGDLTMAKENTDLLREIDYIITSGISEWLKNPGNTNKINQYFGVLIPISTGADNTESTNETKKYSAVIRAVITTDFMTAKAAIPGKDIPIDVIRGIADKIAAEFPEIDLILYDMTGKPPSTVEWE